MTLGDEAQYAHGVTVTRSYEVMVSEPRLENLDESWFEAHFDRIVQYAVDTILARGADGPDWMFVPFDQHGPHLPEETSFDAWGTVKVSVRPSNPDGRL